MNINNNDENHNSSYGDLFSQNSEDSNSFDFNTLEDSLNEVLNENTENEHEVSSTINQPSEKTNNLPASKLENNDNFFDNDMQSHDESVSENEMGSVHVNDVVDNNFDDSESYKDDYEIDKINSLGSEDTIEDYNEEDFDTIDESVLENNSIGLDKKEHEEINISEHISSNNLSQSVKTHEIDLSQQKQDNIDISSKIYRKRIFFN